MNTFDTKNNKPQTDINSTNLDLASVAVSSTTDFRAAVDSEILDARRDAIYSSNLGNLTVTQTGEFAEGKFQITMPSMIASGEPTQGVSLVIPGDTHTSYCFQTDGADVDTQPIRSDLQAGSGPKGIIPSGNPSYSLVL